MTPATLHCFHHDLNLPWFNDLVPYWQLIWQRHGWPTRILTLADAQRHPLYPALDAHARTLPTVNGAEFDRLCFVRWCAFAQVDGAIADSDVFPRVSSYPATAFHISKPWTADPCGGPGFMFGTAADYTVLLNAMFTARLSDAIEVNNRPHLSDMLVLQASHYFHRFNTIACYGVDGWRDRPLTHFGNAYLKGPGSKVDQIRAALKAEGAPHE